MKKIKILLIALILGTTALSAQVSLGVTGGVDMFTSTNGQAASDYFKVLGGGDSKTNASPIGITGALDFILIYDLFDNIGIGCDFEIGFFTGSGTIFSKPGYDSKSYILGFMTYEFNPQVRLALADDGFFKTVLHVGPNIAITGFQTLEEAGDNSNFIGKIQNDTLYGIKAGIDMFFDTYTYYSYMISFTFTYDFTDMFSADGVTWAGVDPGKRMQFCLNFGYLF